jgi:hypothetical protein
VAIGNSVVAIVAVPLANPPSSESSVVTYKNDRHARKVLHNLLCSLKRNETGLHKRYIVFTADQFLLGKLDGMSVPAFDISALPYFAEASQGPELAFQIASYYLAKLAVAKSILHAGYNVALLDQDTVVVSDFTQELNRCESDIRLTWWSPGVNNDHFFPEFDTFAFFMACSNHRTVRLFEAAIGLAKNVSDRVVAGEALEAIDCGTYTHQNYQTLMNSTHSLWANSSYCTDDRFLQLVIGAHKQKEGADKLKYATLSSEMFVSGHSLVNVLKAKYCTPTLHQGGLVLGNGRQCNTEIIQGAKPCVVLGRWVPFRDGNFHFEKELRFLSTVSAGFIVVLTACSNFYFLISWPKWSFNYGRGCSIGL